MLMMCVRLDFFSSSCGFEEDVGGKGEVGFSSVYTRTGEEDEDELENLFSRPRVI